MIKKRILPFRQHLLRLGLVVAVGLAIPTAAVLAHGPDASNKGQSVAASHRPADAGASEDPGKPEDSTTPDSAGSRPHNHGWFVSQVAKSHATSGHAHGLAVSTEAKTDDGK